MKRFPLIIAALLFANLATAQEAKPVELTIGEEGLYQYQEVLEAPGTADELYDRAMTWVALRYNSANDVAQLRDEENHRIIVKGLWDVTHMLAPMWVRHTLQIETREGRYRVTYSRFTVENQSGKSGEMPFEGKIARSGRLREKTSEIIEGSVADLHAAMHLQGAEDVW